MADLYLFALIFFALLGGVYIERLRAIWAKRRWLAKQGIAGQTSKSNIFKRPVTDPAEQLRIVMSSTFEKQRLLSKAEARVFYTVERAAKELNEGWRVMAQVSLGEVLSSADPQAYAAINSKRVDILIIANDGFPIAAVEYQGNGHYQGSAAARDAVKKEALRRAGVRYIEVTSEHTTPTDLTREISRLAQLNQVKEPEG